MREDAQQKRSEKIIGAIVSDTESDAQPFEQKTKYDLSLIELNVTYISAPTKPLWSLRR